MQTMAWIETQARGMWTVFYLDRTGQEEYLFFYRKVDACQKAREIDRMGIHHPMIIAPRGAILNRWGGENLMRMV